MIGFHVRRESKEINCENPPKSLDSQRRHGTYLYLTMKHSNVGKLVLDPPADYETTSLCNSSRQKSLQLPPGHTSSCEWSAPDTATISFFLFFFKGLVVIGSDSQLGQLLSFQTCRSKFSKVESGCFHSGDSMVWLGMVFLASGMPVLGTYKIACTDLSEGEVQVLTGHG